MADDLTTVEGLRNARILLNADKIIRAVDGSSIRQREVQRLLNEVVRDATQSGFEQAQAQMRMVMGIEQEPKPATVSVPDGVGVFMEAIDAFGQREKP